MNDASSCEACSKPSLTGKTYCTRHAPTDDKRMEWECPRCNGRGIDPKLIAEQSCLVCWGQRWIDPHKQVWDMQNIKALEGFLGDHGRMVVVSSDE